MTINMHFVITTVLERFTSADHDGYKQLIMFVFVSGDGRLLCVLSCDFVDNEYCRFF